jgi:hypothetical protein
MMIREQLPIFQVARHYWSGGRISPCRMLPFWLKFSYRQAFQVAKRMLWAWGRGSEDGLAQCGDVVQFVFSYLYSLGRIKCSASA